MSLPGTWAEPFRDAGCTASKAQCATYIGRLTPRSSTMRRLMPTAKTTLLLASTSTPHRSLFADIKKCLQSTPLLDDRRQPVCHSVSIYPESRSILRAIVESTSKGLKCRLVRMDNAFMASNAYEQQVTYMNDKMRGCCDIGFTAAQ